MQRLQLHEATSTRSLEIACDVLAAGGMVIYPTETVYGVGVDATNAEAVSKLLRYKNRPPGKAISVLMADQKMTEGYVQINTTAQQLFKTLLPGPLTVVASDKGLVDSRLVSETGGLGIRMSSHPVADQLITRYQKPITATSANAAGGARPYSIDALLQTLTQTQLGLIDVILDVGILPHREPSTVIDTLQETQEIVRRGDQDSIQTWTTHTPEQTEKKGEELLKQSGYRLRDSALVFALQGDLGAGKTHFTKGIAQALGIKKTITSPSYILMKEYKGEFEGVPVRLHHLDLWRLTKITPEELGLDQLMKSGNCIVIEWPQPVLTDLKSSELASGFIIDFQSPDLTTRNISLENL